MPRRNRRAERMRPEEANFWRKRKRDEEEADEKRRKGKKEC